MKWLTHTQATKKSTSGLCRTCRTAPRMKDKKRARYGQKPLRARFGRYASFANFSVPSTLVNFQPSQAPPSIAVS